MKTSLRYADIAKLAFPVIGAQSAVLVNGLTDLTFVAPFGTGALAAVAVANAFCAMLFNFLEGFRMGTTVLVAGAAAAKDEEKTAAILWTGLVVAALLGCAVALAAPDLSGAVFRLAGEENLRSDGAEYLKIWLWTVPLILWSYVLTGLFRGLGDTVTPLYAAGTVCVLNVALDYFLVPRFGVPGAAWGTLLANGAGTFLLTAMAVVKPMTRRHWKQRPPLGGYLAGYLRLAADVGLNTGFTLLALLLFVGMLKPLGTGALAAHQITLQVFSIAYLPALGFLITASILVPRLLASGQGERVVPAVLRICRLSAGVILALGSVAFWAAPAIGGFFSPQDHAVAELAGRTIRMVCLGQLFSSLYMVLRGALTGCGDTRFILYEGWVSGYLIFLPLAYALAIKAGYGLEGGYAAFVCWCFTDFAALALRFWQKCRSFHKEAPREENLISDKE